jgi:cell division septum initiation protein DivIVA
MAIDDLLSEGTRTFRTRWLGYDRDQVDEEYTKLEGLLGHACADRDAALATAEDLTRHLEEARSELAEYRMIHAGHSKDAVSGCIRYLLHVARCKADEIEAGAQSRAEQALRQAEEAAGRQARLLDEAEQETQRRLAEANRRAREIVGEALEQSRVMLADLAERQRLLDQWYSDVESTPNMPLPRRGEPRTAEVERTAVAYEPDGIARTAEVERTAVDMPSVTR